MSVINLHVLYTGYNYVYDNYKVGAMKSRHQSLADSIVADLREISKEHRGVFDNMRSCINAINQSSADIGVSRVGMKDDGYLSQLQKFQSEQVAAYELLALYKQPVPPLKGFGVFSRHPKEEEAIRNKIADIVKTYFLRVEGNRKLTPDEISEALIGKVQSTQHLINLLKSTWDKDKSVLDGLKDIAFWQSVSDFDANKDLWHEYHQQLLKHPAFQRQYSNSFVIKECFIDASMLEHAREHHFTAPKDPVSLDSIITPVAGLLAVGLAGTSGNAMPVGEAIKFFTGALDHALLMKKNGENTIWETDAPLPKENVKCVIYPDKDGAVQQNKESFNFGLVDAYNESIASGMKRSVAVWHVYFIELDDQAQTLWDKNDNSQKVFLFTLEQANKFVRFLKEHPLWYDNQDGWRLSQYKDFIPFREMVINKLCDVMDELNQGLDQGTKAAIRDELVMFRRYQSSDMHDVIQAFQKSKQYCQRLLHLGQKPDKHPLDKCFAKVEAELEWMQKMLKTSKAARQRLQSDVLQDEAVIAVRDFKPGLLVKQLGTNPMSKHNVEAAYVECLQNYLQGRPKTAVEFNAVREEYEFLSQPLHRKAFSEKVDQERAVSKKSEMEMGEIPRKKNM